MPMMPKRVKFRKSQRGKMKGNASRGNTVAFGEFVRGDGADGRGDHSQRTLTPAMRAWRGQRHPDARYLIAPPPERLVQFGGIDAVQPQGLIGHDDSVAVDDLGGAGQAFTPSARASAH